MLGEVWPAARFNGGVCMIHTNRHGCTPGSARFRRETHVLIWVNPAMSEKKIVTSSWCSGSICRQGWLSVPSGMLITQQQQHRQTFRIHNQGRFDCVAPAASPTFGLLKTTRVTGGICQRSKLDIGLPVEYGNSPQQEHAPFSRTALPGFKLPLPPIRPHLRPGLSQ